MSKKEALALLRRAISADELKAEIEILGSDESENTYLDFETQWAEALIDWLASRLARATATPEET